MSTATENTIYNKLRLKHKKKKELEGNSGDQVTGHGTCTVNVTKSKSVPNLNSLLPRATALNSNL